MLARQADFFFGLTQGGLDGRTVVVLAAAAGETDLSCVILQVSCTLSEENRHPLLAQHDRDQHRGQPEAPLGLGHARHLVAAVLGLPARRVGEALAQPFGIQARGLQRSFAGDGIYRQIDGIETGHVVLA